MMRLSPARVSAHTVLCYRSPVDPPDCCASQVPEAATKAWLRRMYAVRALRSNKPGEARALLTEALKEASTLRGDAANLLSHLLEFRADIAESLGDVQARDADRAHALQMRSLTKSEAVAGSGTP